MCFSLIITFLLLLGLVITSLQNSMPLELKLITWNFQMSFAALTLYSSLIGGAIVAVPALPKLVRKSLERHRRFAFWTAADFGLSTVNEKGTVSTGSKSGFNKRVIKCQPKEYRSVSQNHFERGF